MKAVIQTVLDARVTVDGEVTGAIRDGMLIYFGVARDDSIEDVAPFCDKIAKLRIFKDDKMRMNVNLKNHGGEILLVSQFTLETDIYSGNRPSMDAAAPGYKAEEFYIRAQEHFRALGFHVETGKFGAHMLVSYVNDGPETFVLESRDLFRKRGC